MYSECYLLKVLLDMSMYKCNLGQLMLFLKLEQAASLYILTFVYVIQHMLQSVCTSWIYPSPHQRMISSLLTQL